MKRRLLLLSVFTLLLCLPAAAYSFEDGGIYYVIQGNSVSVTYETSDYNSYSGEVTIPAVVEYGGKEYTVEGIYTFAFRNCTELTKVVFGDNITTIGNNAFDGCTNLASVTLSSKIESIGQSAFRDCSALIELALPSTLTSISSFAFDNCSSLTEMTLPDGVTSLSNYLFRNCSSLTKATLGNSVESVGDYAFYGCTSLEEVNLPSTLTSIGRYAFYDCQSLQNIVLPEGLTSIDGYAFYNCYSFTQITIPDGVTTIPNYAFYQCKAMTTAVLGEGIESIGTSAFYKCSSLKEVNIPDKVTSIGDYAFRECSSLQNIELPEVLTSLGEQAFRYCTSLEAINIPDGVTTIATSTFAGCTALASIVWGTGLESIGNYAFQSCSSLTTLDIPYGVTSFGTGAFYDDSGLTEVTLPATVTSVGQNAFYDSTKSNALATFTSLNTTPPSCGSYVFYTQAYSDCVLLVPLDSKALYANADIWKNFKTIIGLNDDGSIYYSVATGAVEDSDVTYNSATLTATIDGYIDGVTTKGFYYYAEGGSGDPQIHVVTTDDFSCTIDGLQPETTYYYNAFIKTFDGYEYQGEQLSFTTAAIIAPTVTTIAATDITSSSATISGEYEEASEPIISWGFDYWITDGTIWHSDPSTAETITLTLTSLTEATTYTYRLYVITADNIYYGDELTFTTLNLTLYTTLTSEIQATSDALTTAWEAIQTNYPDVAENYEESCTTIAETLASLLTTTEESYYANTLDADGTRSTLAEIETEIESIIAAANSAENEYLYSVITPEISAMETTLTEAWETIQTEDADIADTLIDDYNAIVTKLSTLASDIESAKDSETLTPAIIADAEKTLAEIQSDIEKLLAKATTSENDYLYNIISPEITAMETTLTEAWATIQTDDADIADTLIDDYNAIVSKLSTLASDIESAKESEALTPEIIADAEATLAEIQSDIEKLLAKATTSENDYLYNVISPEISAMRTTLTEAWTTIQSDAADIADSLIDDYNAIVSKLSTLTDDIESAKDSETLTPAIIADAEKTLAEIQSDIEKLLAKATTSENEYLYSVITDEISSIESDLATAWATITTDCADVAESFTDDYNSIAADIASLKDDVKEVYDAGEINADTVTSTETTIAAIQKAISDLVNAAQSAQEQYDLNASLTAAVGEVQESLEETWDEISETYPDIIEDIYDDYESIAAALDGILSDISEGYATGTLSEAQADEIAGELEDVKSDIADLVTAAEAAQEKYEYDKLYESAAEEIQATSDALAEAWETITTEYPEMVGAMQDTYEALAEEIANMLDDLAATYEAGELTEDTIADITSSLAGIDQEITDMLDSVVPTSISAIDTTTADVKIYTLSGTQVNTVEKGQVYIYRSANGAAKKVLVK